MAEYKCISCGEIKDSDQSCSCHNCGYKMFAAPYDRKTVLINEIRTFLNHLQISTVNTRDMSFYRLVPKTQVPAIVGEEEKFDIVPKAKDDQRFPNFLKIQNYVCSSNKTEEFFERLNTSLSQIRKYTHTAFHQEYKTSLDTLKTRADSLDAVLIEALSDLSVQLKIEQAVMPEVKLLYSETPDESLLISADDLLDSLDKLSVKILRFIKQNNIYGTAYKKKPKNTFVINNEGNYIANLDECAGMTTMVLNKKHTVDIFSDGTDELSEMLTALWNAIAAIMTIPILTISYRYQFENSDNAIGDDVFGRIIGISKKRYAALNDIVLADVFLLDRSEDQLFELYNKMIERDSFGFMGISKEGLLKIGESENKLNALIGLSSIKESIKKIKAYALSNKDSDDLNIHMCFYGNPGTGKTEVARIIAGILYENKILPSKKVVEVDRSGLIGQYVGETPQKTMEKIEEAMGGVLFIDEAYALIPKDGGGWDYGQEAVATLVKAMEDYRGKFCVILAGYKNQMIEMISSNPGFKSRIQFELDFPNYSRDELTRITELMLRNRKYTISHTAMAKLLDITDVKRKEPNFANAREIRNILDQVIMCQNLRSIGSNDKELGIVDVNRYIHDAKVNLPTSEDGQERRILTGDEELEQLIGLASVKRMIKKIKAYAKRNMNDANFSMHMCFYGNPGTGKTEVARILSRILYDARVLPEAKLVETDSHGLVGKYVGETAPKTKAKIQDAIGGVLFIDEAYGLISTTSSNSSSTGYGAEAVEVLLKEMEDRRGQFCVILAGYQNEIKTMLSSNPGLESRIQFTLDFPDFSRGELGEITVSFLNKKKYEIEKNALERILDVTDYFRQRANFANARTIRNILDQVIMNQNLRTEDTRDDNMIIIDDVEQYLTDEGINLSEEAAHQGKIGFF